MLTSVVGKIARDGSPPQGSATRRLFSAGVILNSWLLVGCMGIAVPGLSRNSDPNADLGLLAALGLASGSQASTSVSYDPTQSTTLSAEGMSLFLPAGAASSKMEITARAVAAPSGVEGAGRAWEFGPSGTEFNAANRPVLTLQYDPAALSAQGRSEDSLMVYWYDPDRGEYVAEGRTTIDKERHTVSVPIEHFTIYLPAAQAQLAGNAPPIVGASTQLPTTARAGAPLYVRSVVTDPGSSGSLAAVTLYYRVVGASAYTAVPMSIDQSSPPVADRYGAVIPAAAVTTAGVQFYVEATDNFGAVKANSITKRTPNTSMCTVTASVTTMTIAAGFQRLIAYNGTAGNNCGTSVTGIIPESFTTTGGIGTTTNAGSTGLIFQATTVGSGSVIATLGAFTPATAITVKSGTMAAIQILNESSQPINGTLNITPGYQYHFDVRGIDPYGNTVLIVPTWSTTGSIGTFTTSTSGILNTTSGSGTVKATAAGMTNSLNVVVVAPSTPTGVTIAAGDAQNTVSWSAATGANSYNIYYTNDGSTPSKLNGNKLAAVTSPYSHAALTNGILYKYTVTSANAGSESAESSVVQATPVVYVPPVFPSVTISSISHPYVSAGGFTSTNIVWNSSDSGFPYTVRIGGSSCSTGVPSTEGTITTGTNGSGTTSGTITTTIPAAELTPGPNLVRICVVGSAGIGHNEIIVTRDDFPPVLTATPGGGTFSTSQTVSASCTDGGWSGCVPIIYTTDGSAPAFDADGNIANGQVYTSALTAGNPSLTVLKFAARDGSGNTVSLSQTYAVDSTVPNVTVVSMDHYYLSAAGYSSGTLVWTTNRTDSLPFTIRRGQSCASGTIITGTNVSGNTPSGGGQVTTIIPFVNLTEASTPIMICVQNYVGDYGAVGFHMYPESSFPVVGVKNVRNKGVMHSGFLIGTAADNYGIETVEVSVDGGDYSPVTTTSAYALWKFQLPTGTTTWRDGTQHTILVRVRDISGQVTTANAITVRKGTNQDVNGDGYSDLIVGAEGYGNGQGRLYIYHGGYFPPVVIAQDGGVTPQPATSANTIITGESTVGAGRFGYSTTADFNGDGYADVLTSAFQADLSTGKVYIFHSSGTAGITTTNAANANRIITGDANGINFGIHINTGDMNGDGYADALITSYNGSAVTGKVHAYYAYGTNGITATSSAMANRTFTGDTTHGQIHGWAGEINGDGYADVLIGAPQSNPGRAHIFYSWDAPTGPVYFSAADRVITGSNSTQFGRFIATGDVDGDRYNDVSISAVNLAFVFRTNGPFGLTAAIDTDANRIFQGENQMGHALAMGDINGDGFADLVASDYAAAGSNGRVYVYYSAGSSFFPSLAAGTAHSTVTGAYSNGYFGLNMALCDLDGDTYSDLLMGSMNFNSAQGMVSIFRSYGSSGIPTGYSNQGPWIINGEAQADQFFNLVY